MKKNFAYSALYIIIAMCLIISVSASSLDTPVSDSNINFSKTEKISDDPMCEEIYALADEIAESINYAIGLENKISADMIDFSSAYKNYTEDLFNAYLNSSVTASEYDYVWNIVYNHNDSSIVIVTLAVGQGISSGSPYQDIINGKRKGTEEEWESIKRLQAREGHYYVASYGIDNNNLYHKIINENSNLDGMLYFAAVPNIYGENAAILVRDNDISIRYAHPDVLNSYYGAKVSDNFVSLDNVKDFHTSINNSAQQRSSDGEFTYGGNAGVFNDTHNVSLLAISIMIISAVSLAILLITRRNHIYRS